MAIYSEYYWPIVSLTAVCLLQDGDGDAPLVLNGDLKNLITNQISFLEAGYSRNVSIGSTDDNSAVIFTVNGFQNGVAVSEDIQGPNATLVEGTEVFDTITSITTNGAFANIEVGTGNTGFLPLIQINTLPNTSIINFSIQSILNDETNLKYTKYDTLAKIPQLKRTYLDLLDNTQYLLQYGNADIASGEVIVVHDLLTSILFHVTAGPTEEGKIDDLRVIYRQV